jgi:hypothetical protein
MFWHTFIYDHKVDGLVVKNRLLLWAYDVVCGVSQFLMQMVDTRHWPWWPAERLLDIQWWLADRVYLTDEEEQE